MGFSPDIPRALAMAVFFLVAACQPAENGSSARLGHEHRFPLGLGGASIEAQLALTSQEAARGLMHREALEPNEGMLFLFPSPRRASFWMKNTPLPLDVGFFDPDGRLLEIRRLHPHDETPVVSHGENVLIAVEMRQGWFRENSVRPGAQLDLDALRQAIRARGFDPRESGL